MIKGVRIGFVSCVIGDPADGLHLTLARRYDATEVELVAMQSNVDQIIRPRFPLRVEWGNFCSMGEAGTFPAYRVHVTDPVVIDFYKTYYKEAPGKAMWPQPEYHVTVDTPAKRAALEALIRSSTKYEIRSVTFKTRVEGGVEEEALPASAAEARQWHCAVCGCYNDMSHRACKTEGCDQWRPKPAAVAPPQQRVGDWQCCGMSNFASRSQCMRCGGGKPGSFVSPASSMKEYDAPPSAPTKKQVMGNGIHRPDWNCSKCNFKIFGSKDSCFKCGTRNPAL